MIKISLEVRSSYIKSYKVNTFSDYYYGTIRPFKCIFFLGPNVLKILIPTVAGIHISDNDQPDKPAVGLHHPELFL